MPDIDFTASATRHLQDARLLFEAGRHDNSFYLAGYVVECALKAVSQWSGLAPERLGHKLLKLEGDALDLAMAIAPATARYRPPTGSVQSVNSTWSTECRYYSASISAPRAELVLREARKVWEACIGQMFLDGLIEELP